jgi:hypothetical protein
MFVPTVGTLADHRLISVATHSLDLVILRGLVERAEGQWPLSLQQQQLDQLVYIRDLLSEFMKE